MSFTSPSIMLTPVHQRLLFVLFICQSTCFLFTSIVTAVGIKFYMSVTTVTGTISVLIEGASVATNRYGI